MATMQDGLLYRFDLMVRSIHRLLRVFGKTRVLSIAGLFEEHFECPLRWELVFGHCWKLCDLVRFFSELPCFELEGRGDVFVNAVVVASSSAFNPPAKLRVLRRLKQRLKVIPSEMLKRNLLLPPKHWVKQATEADRLANEMYEAAEKHAMSKRKTPHDLEEKARESAVMYEQQARQARKMQRSQTMTQLHLLLASEDAVRDVRQHYDDSLRECNSTPSKPTATLTSITATIENKRQASNGAASVPVQVTARPNSARSSALQQLPCARIGAQDSNPAERASASESRPHMAPVGSGGFPPPRAAYPMVPPVRPAPPPPRSHISRNQVARTSDCENMTQGDARRKDHSPHKRMREE